MHTKSPYRLSRVPRTPRYNQTDQHPLASTHKTADSQPYTFFPILIYSPSTSAHGHSGIREVILSKLRSTRAVIVLSCLRWLLPLLCDKNPRQPIDSFENCSLNVRLLYTISFGMNKKSDIFLHKLTSLVYVLVCFFFGTAVELYY